MNIIDTLNGSAAILIVAKRKGKSYAEIEAEIQEALDNAWDTLKEKYPDGELPVRKPTVAEFVGWMGRCIREGKLPTEGYTPT